MQRTRSGPERGADGLTLRTVSMKPGVAMRAGVNLIRQAVVAYFTHELIAAELEIGEEE